MKGSIYIVILAAFFMASCGNAPNTSLEADTSRKGTFNISVDESFKPVIQEQLKVYQASYPEAKITASYKAEVECFRDLEKDSTKMIIVSRGLTDNEIAHYDGELGYKPQFTEMAYDAIAVIVNVKDKDSVFKMKDLQDILSGLKSKTAIMDGTNATSTVKMLQDSVLRGKKFGKNVVAVNGSAAVVDAVMKSENAIGFVGLSWVGNTNDPKQAEQLNTIKLARVECVKCEEKGVFAKPSQATITYAQYPLARPLFYIVKENYKGPALAFAAFMREERGQLIFRRAAIAPSRMDFKKRGGNL